MDDVTLYEAYFQKSKSYYLNRLDWYLKGQKYSFNLFAFLFGLFWFMYRKMYLEAAVIFLAMIVEGFLESFILRFSPTIAISQNLDINEDLPHQPKR